MKLTAPLLGVAVVTAAVVAALARPQPSAPKKSYEPVTAPGAAWNAADGATETLRGKVLETIDVSEYTYVRLATDHGEEWSAVSKAAVAVGSQVEVVDATRMENFSSPTLGRTFPAIYFGRLGGGSAPALPPGHPTVAGGEAPPPGHGSALPAASTSLPDVAVAKAQGPNAYVIAEVYGSRDRLEGKVVRVAGQVAKVTTGVLGKNYLRLRDGSSTEPLQRELVVTTLVNASVGDVITLQGKVEKDVDVGIGYTYPVLLADAERVSTP
jgi:hypothetical protein